MDRFVQIKLMAPRT